MMDDRRDVSGISNAHRAKHHRNAQGPIGRSGLFVAACLGCPLLAIGALDDAPEIESAAPSPATSIRFERLPPSVLPEFQHFNGHPRASLLPEDNGSGCAWGDFDGDGDDNLFLCNFNGPYLMDPAQRRRQPGSRLWRNDGGRRFVDVTEAVGLASSRMDMGAVFADYDNDGDPDLLVTSLEGVRLYRNDGGKYVDATEAGGLGGVGGYCLGAVWGDYDRDGRLDLYICRYVDFPIERARRRDLVAGRPAPMTTPSSYPPLANHLFRQQPDGTFRDVTDRAKVAAAKGRSMQAIWCDFDNDGWIDLFVANDQSLDCLFHNQQDGTFTDVAVEAGVFDPRGAMGIAVLDHQADGDQDLFISHWVGEDPALYVNESRGQTLIFDDHATRVGLRKHDGALVGWGTGFEDFDNDGDQDLFVVYGSTIEDELTLDVLKAPKMLPQQSQIYEFRDGRWWPLGSRAGAYFAETHVGRGAAVADFDRDGRLDLAINNHSGAPAVLRNVSSGSGNWLWVELQGSDCARDAANSRVTVYCDGKPNQTRELFLGASYLSGHSKVLHFGLGQADRI
ncbi:MAG: CRTAC1 family protein, partial [Planctomycetes bacterium]|nr:CRTAC1 family protein [Planctomycetota bacterium]